MRIPTSPVVLVGNYLPDRQFSMLQYAGMLERELHTMGARVILTAPKEIFGRLVRSNKWLGYIDKLLLFPRS
ncbi:uncharacterized protein METZ01_LOCUS462379, partial [marine metagenome]